MIITSITDGVSRDIGSCALVVTPIDDKDYLNEYKSIYIEWTKGLDPEFAELELIASGMVKFGNSIIILGRLGQINCVTSGVFTQERIECPEKYGFLTDIKVIDNLIYVVGMCRQIYVSSNGEVWDRFDFGVLDENMQINKVTGFRGIDGVSNNDLYAVGLNGEIWNYRNNIWGKMESPTNVTLEQVKVITSNKVYAIGQAGVILRGNGETWELFEQKDTEDDFWTLEWFNNSLYLATASELFIIDSKGDFKQVTPKKDGPKNFSRLRSSEGVLWSFGPEKVYWTLDGKTWEEAKIFNVIEG